MPETITIRPTTPRDLAAVDQLLAESFPVQLKQAYPPSVLVTALPLLARANPVLLRSGTYFLAEAEDGRVLAAGGWSHRAPQGGVGPRDLGHIRHVVTHPSATRQGLGRALLEVSLADARAQGMTRLLCESTRNAVPFYEALGFRARGEIVVSLRPGIGFPVVEMTRQL